MRVIALALCRIDDHRCMDEQIAESHAIAELVKGYNTLAARSFSLPDPDLHLCVVGASTYGNEFKQWLTYLPSQDRWRLLDRYLANFPQHAEGDARTERDPIEPLTNVGRDPEAHKDRQLKRLFLRFLMVMIFMCMVMVFSAGVAMMQQRHLLPDNVVLKTIMETAAELAKILFTLK